MQKKKIKRKKISKHYLNFSFLLCFFLLMLLKNTFQIFKLNKKTKRIIIYLKVFMFSIFKTNKKFLYVIIFIFFFIFVNIDIKFH